LGQFIVNYKISLNAYKLKLPVSRRIHEIKPVSLFDLIVDDRLVGLHVNPPPPVEVDGDEVYEVSSVQDS
jgi:hypothetical protein